MSQDTETTLTITYSEQEFHDMKNRLHEIREERRRVKNCEAAAKRRNLTKELEKQVNQLETRIAHLEDDREEQHDHIERLNVLATHLAILIKGTDQRQMANHLLGEMGLQPICGGDNTE